MCATCQQTHHQRIFSSFLLILLFAPAAIEVDFSAKDCPELIKSPQCECAIIFGGFKIQCPIMVQNPKIKIEVNKFHNELLTLECNDFDDEEYYLLPAINVSNVRRFFMVDCPLPNKPISYLSTHLGIQELNSLRFENLNLTLNITREHLSGLKDMESLTLNVNDLSFIREDLFMDLSYLEILYIYSSNISFTRNTFANLARLRRLKLRVPNLQKLPVDIFRSQRNLEVLDLSNTPLPNISKGIFEIATSISFLYLISNSIERFQPDVFSLLTNLEAINLSDNNFWYLPSELFAHNKELTTVLMYNSTSLKALPSKLFGNLPKLRVAHIICDNDFVDNSLTSGNMVRIHCDLEEIPHDLFVNSSAITKISLSKNKLATLAKTLLEYQFLLDYLDLSHNRLQFLSKALFRNKNQLTVLKLSHNYLTAISRDLFSNLRKLRNLYLNNNHIVTIDSDAFKYNNNLGSVYLENNYINATEAFESLWRLETLNLHNNTLRHILRGDGMYNFKELDLSHNFISSLNYSDLLFHSKMISINLNSNRIRKINITYEFLLLNKYRFLTVQLNNNPIDCDCNLLPFLQRIRGDLSEMLDANLNFKIDELFCNKPDNLKNLNLLDVEPSALLCTFNFERFEPPHCPMGCECWERTYTSLLLVNCSSTNLTEVPTLPRSQPLGLQSIELHLENNELKELPIVFTSGYKDVTHIFAAGNKLSHINVSNLPEHLTYLDLSRNKFKGLNVNVIHFLKQNTSRRIALSENPWNCDCESMPLMLFVGQSHEMINDNDKVYCASPKNSNMIEYFNTKDICQYGQDVQIALSTWVVGISVVCFSITFTAALFYKYQTEIKIWMYKYNLCSWWVNEEKLDEDKTYDAFVSYSSKDEEFVLGLLVPQLEKGPIRFKLCVHQRDFIVGDIIPDQIVRAIADSRRTIVVLSENFIKSSWARIEFRLAHQAGLDEKRTKVIAIVYGEIGDIRLLDLELQSYLKMTTYLEWGNPWFWERLRNVMPHRIRRNDVGALELNELSTAQNATEAAG